VWDRSIFKWQTVLSRFGKILLSFICQNVKKEYIWRKLFALLKENIRGHWNATIIQMSEELCHFYEGLDGDYWQMLDSEFRNKRQQLNDTLTSPEGQIPSNSDTNMSTSDGKLVPNEDKFARQVSLVHEFDNRQLKISLERKDIRRTARWELVRMMAETKEEKQIQTSTEKEMTIEITTETGITTRQETMKEEHLTIENITIEFGRKKKKSLKKVTMQQIRSLLIPMICSFLRK